MRTAKEWFDKNRKLERNLGSYATPPGCQRAFTRVELLFTILATTLIAGVLILSGCQTIQEQKAETCRNNLKQIGLAFRIWSGDCGDSYPMRVPENQGGSKEPVQSGRVFIHYRVMSNELNTPKILRCPADQEKSAAVNFEKDFSDANISYFVGLDAADTSPQMLLSGDRNLTVDGKPLSKGMSIVTTNTVLAWSDSIHQLKGHVAICDGSVQLQTSDQLTQTVRLGDPTTNRIVLP